MTFRDELATDGLSLGSGLLAQAVLATDVSFTMADARVADVPLTWVNPAFTITTGYTFAESVGQNCRFLQGAETDPAEVARLHIGIAEGLPVTATLLNYRKDGSTFWNQLTINPLRDAAGELTHFVGMQVDVTARVEADLARDRALAAEREATARARDAQAGMALLAEVSNELANSLSVGDSLERLAQVVLPALADWVVVYPAVDNSHVVSMPIVRHKDGHEDLTGRYATLAARFVTDDSPYRLILRGGQSWMQTEFDPAQAAAWSIGTELSTVRDDLGIASAMYVALPGRRGVVGAMVLIRGADSPRFTESDFRLAVDLGQRTGLTIENARLYENEHRVAEGLQRSLLPDLPAIDGLEIAARYNAAQDGAQVGGDFYDVLALPTGRTAIVIGDVVGHDVAAAAAMGHLRGLIQAVAWDVSTVDGSPDAILRRVDRLVQGIKTVPMATVTYAELDEAALNGSRTLRYSSAGHPPLLVKQPDGRADYLVNDPGLLLGVEATTRTSQEARLEPGSTLLAFTDGLFERRGEDIDDGMELLRVVVQDAPSTYSADELCQEVIDWLGDSEDDTALLAIRIH